MKRLGGGIGWLAELILGFSCQLIGKEETPGPNWAGVSSAYNLLLGS